MNGAEYFFEVLHRSGIRRIFGNPGSTELPLLDALVTDDRLQYTLALQEIPAMAMADGYSQATRSPSVANFHAGCGLGNAMGMLYNSWASGTPLMVTAGQQDRRLLAEEPVLAGNTVAVAGPWTKWAHEVHRVGDIGAAVRRAIRTALEPPTGPVFLSLPVDLQIEEVTDPDLAPAQSLASWPCAPRNSLERAAAFLAGAKAPVILAGCRVTEYGAAAELAELARKLGAPVFSDTHASQGRLPIAPDNPFYAGSLPLWSPDIQNVLAPFDTALVVGMDFLRQYIYREPASPVPDGLKLIQLDVNAREVGKNYPVELGLTGDIRHCLAEICKQMAVAQNWEQARGSLERHDRIAENRQAQIGRLRSEIAEMRGRHPMSNLDLIGSLADALPADAVFVEEAPTTNRNLLARLGALKDPSGYFGHRGWALGWGLGAALGVKLAWPERPTLALLGDGATLYGVQGLWTAAHYSIPVTFVVADNAQYKILKDVGPVMGLPQASLGNHLALDLTDPTIDFVRLAEGFGVEAHRVTESDELRELAAASFRSDKPLLIEVPVEA